MFRGGEGMPITSGKVSYAGSWEDCKEVVEYVHKTYLAKARQSGKRARLYIYGCSLGAQIAGLYLAKDKERAHQILDGAILYGTPWSTVKGEKFIYNNAFGFYSKVIGLALSESIRKEQLPHLQKYLSEEDYQYYSHIL